MSDLISRNLKVSGKPTGSDLINRRDAIDALQNEYCAFCEQERTIRKLLESLPSAEPEITLESAIDYLNSIDWLPEHDRIITESAKRKSAQRKGKWIEDARTYYETLNERGYFVDQHTEYFVDDIACSECLKRFSTIDNETERFDFCPNCGADMRGEEDGKY